MYSDLIKLIKTGWDDKGRDQMYEIGSLGDHISEIGSLRSDLGSPELDCWDSSSEI